MNRALKEILTSAVMACLMLAACWAARAAGLASVEFTQRALLVLIGANLVRSGNAIPKARVRLERAAACGARGPSLRRFSGWTWVLAGLALVCCALLLPARFATDATLIVLPIAIAAIAIHWITQTRTPRATA